MSNSAHCASHRVPYLWLARTFVEIEQYTARTEIIRLLTNMFRSVVELSPNDLLACVYLTINKVWAFLSSPRFGSCSHSAGDRLG